jgi:hypothetical protein
MPLPYRTVLRLPASVDLIQLAEQEVQTWLTTRRKVPREHRAALASGALFEQGVHALGDASSLTVARADRDEDGSRRVMLRFVEATDSGRWQVTVTGIDYRRGASLEDALIVEALRVDEPDAAGQVDPPAVVRQMLERESVLDGATPVTAEPRTIAADQVDDVYAAITDPTRSVSVIVAAAFDASMVEALRIRVRSLTSKVLGVSAVFVLTPEAADALDGRLPRSHAVDRGRVRTYLPAVDLGSAVDGRRHRVLGPATFASAIRGRNVAPYLQSAFAEETRSALLARPLASDVRRALRALETEIATAERVASVRREVDEVRESPERTAGTVVGDLWDRARAFVGRWLGIQADQVEERHFDDVDVLVATLEAEQRARTREAAEATSRLAALSDEHEALVYEHEFRELELAEAEGDLERLRERTRFLQQELLKVGRPDVAFADVDAAAWEVPDGLEELATLLRAGSTHLAAKRVVFTGDLDPVRDTTIRDLNGLYLQRCWQFVHALFDYAQLRADGGFAGNMHAYLQSGDHDGAKVPLSRHAPSETAATAAKWGKERTFPVPLDVDPTGTRLMLAHFKAGQRDTFAPRLHYLDDTDRTGRVYIGYIGRHLTNTKTSNS